jgi:hypothetical protein
MHFLSIIEPMKRVLKQVRLWPAKKTPPFINLAVNYERESIECIVLVRLCSWP